MSHRPPARVIITMALVAALLTVGCDDSDSDCAVVDPILDSVAVTVTAAPNDIKISWEGGAVGDVVVMLAGDWAWGIHCIEASGSAAGGFKDCITSPITVGTVPSGAVLGGTDADVKPMVSGTEYEALVSRMDLKKCEDHHRTLSGLEPPCDGARRRVLLDISAPEASLVGWFVGTDFSKESDSAAASVCLYT